MEYSHEVPIICVFEDTQSQILFHKFENHLKKFKHIKNFLLIFSSAVANTPKNNIE